MNIFALDSDPRFAARYHFDKHVIKMVTEYAQLLSTAHRICDGEPGTIVREEQTRNYEHALPEDKNHIPLVSHVNHPCAIWARDNTANYMWLFDLYRFVAREYSIRYSGSEEAERQHAAFSRYHEALSEPPENCRELKRRRPFVVCVPDEFKRNEAVQSYRSYYKYGKKPSLHEWRVRGIPYWWGNFS